MAKSTMYDQITASAYGKHDKRFSIAMFAGLQNFTSFAWGIPSKHDIAVSWVESNRNIHVLEMKINHIHYQKKHIGS